MDTVVVARIGAIAVVTLNRPQVRNAMSAQLLAELQEALTAVERDSAVRCVVLTGAGDSFCAGGDLAEADWVGRDSSPFASAYQLTHQLRRLPPVIAAIDGWAAGGGLELAAAADIRLGTERARFSAPEVSVGTVIGSGSSLLLPLLIGQGRAADLVLRGTPRDAAWALAAGLLNDVLPTEAFLDRVLEVAHDIAGHAPLALRESKRLLNAQTDALLDAALERELEAAGRLGRTEDAQEGARAFQQRRRPVFAGR